MRLAGLRAVGPLPLEVRDAARRLGLIRPVTVDTSPAPSGRASVARTAEEAEMGNQSGDDVCGHVIASDRVINKPDSVSVSVSDSGHGLEHGRSRTRTSSGVGSPPRSRVSSVVGESQAGGRSPSPGSKRHNEIDSLRR